MKKKTVQVRGGFTLTELAIAIMLSLIVVSAIGIMMVDGLRGWNVMLNRVQSDVANDSHVAGRTFEAVIRKASYYKVLLDDAGQWVEVYYPGPGSVVADEYARFFQSGSELRVEYGRIDPRLELSTQRLCSNVSACVFRMEGRAIQMIVTLDDGSQKRTVVSSGVMHNRR